MPRRPKSRITQLSDALEAVQRAGRCLDEVDLRATSREVREAVKDSRAQSATLVTRIADAIRADVPSTPGQRRAPRETSAEAAGVQLIGR